MKKNLKRVLCLTLCLVMLFTTSSVAFAAQKVTPVIIISGMGAFPLYDEQGKSAWPLEQKSLVKDIAGMLPSASYAILTGKWNAFNKYGLQYVYDLFEPMACDKDGNSIHKLTPVTFPESVSHYHDTFGKEGSSEDGVIAKVANSVGWKNTYFFYYDWRMNPMDLADELDVMVKKALKEHHTDKVSFLALSFGGMIASSYMYKYGSDHIKNVVHGTTAFLGVDLVGKAFSGQIEVRGDSAIEYFYARENNERLASIMGLAIDYVKSSYGKDANDIINTYLASAVDVIKDPLYLEVFADTFAHMPGIWCLMPASYYKQCRAYMKDKAEFGKNFFKDIDNYILNVQAKTDKLFKSAIKKGTHIYVIGAYGCLSNPLVKGPGIQADNLIETEYQSGFCTVAPYNKTLTKADYTRKAVCTNKKHNHKSTDNIIDASTALLPEHTWVIKGMQHVEFNVKHQTSDLLVWLIKSEKYVNINSDKRYPQFTELDRESGRLRSLTKGVKIPNEPAAKDPPVSIFNTFTSFIRELLKTMFCFFYHIPC